MMGDRKEPSIEQNQIINHKGNCVVTARPGSGKTFTIVEKIALLSKDLLDYQGIIAISFTRKASHELSVRCKNKGINKGVSFYGTIDNFYISQIITPFAKHLTNSNVKLEVLSDLDKNEKFKELLNLKRGSNCELEMLLIDSLKEGKIFLDICGEIAFFILNNVEDCIKYLKARYTHIFIDEYQDCGLAQHSVFMKLVAGGLFGIAVGDLDQAIYGFAGRDSKYLVDLIKDDNFKHFQILKNHRCHKTISNYSLKLLGGNPVKLEEESRVFKVDVVGSDEQIMQAIDKYLPTIKEKYEISKNSDIGILCRNNNTAQRANKYLKTKSKLFTETELDRYNSHWARIFNDLLQSYFDPNTYVIDFVSRYIDEEHNPRIFAKGMRIINEIFSSPSSEVTNKESLFIEFANLVYPDHFNSETVTVFSEVLSDWQVLLTYKPASDDEVCVLTLHKSKGLEFKVIFHLDLYKWIFPWENIPEEEYIQSLNLHYVGITRAIEVCYLMIGSTRYRPQQGDYLPTAPSPFLQIAGLNELRRAVKWNL